MPTLFARIAAALWLMAAATSATAEQMATASAVQVDGVLSETVWQQAPIITGFRQRDPTDGAKATFETEVRVAYDGSALYVAVQAIDPDPARIVGIRTRRDGGSPSDWIRVMVDSFHDRRSAYEFSVNPAGVKSDTYWFNDTNNDQGWDAVWDVAVARNERGWRAEFRIPFSQLRFHPAADASFGFAVVREIGRLNEVTSWPLLSKSATGFVSSFGEITGLRLGSSQKRLELVPYVVGDVNTRPVDAGNPLVSARDGSAEVGLDLKYALRPGLTLTATVNPDFGQVEADPAVVNLSAFETFFSERRPFFVEGSGVFGFDTDCNDGSCSGLFYSRRIGRAPRGEPEVSEGGFVNVPAQTTILGAAKLTGRVGAFSLGVMNAVTADEEGVVANGALRTRETVEPLTAYTVARAKREFANQSGLGFIATSTNRGLDDATRFLPGQAYTGGVDWDWRLGARYAMTGFVAGSSVRGDAGAIAALQESNVHSYQRPDADHIELDPSRTALNGSSGILSFSKIGGQRVRFTSNVSLKTPGFDSNDVGFLRRADSRNMSNWLQWRHDRPSKYLRSFRFNLNQWGGWNFAGDRLNLGYNVNAHATFTNQWGVGSGVNYNPQSFDDRATRGGPGAYGSTQKSIWAYVESDGRKPIQGGLNVFVARNDIGSRSSDLSPYLTWRPSSFLSVTTGLSLSDNDDRQQWVENEADRYVFARLEQRTVSMTARVDYTVTPNLSIQIYAEPFVSAGDYSGFLQLVDGRARDFTRRFAAYDYGGTPDFNYRSFRTTNVLRWEYRPGSTLFAVWQQGREGTRDTGSFAFRRDFGGVFDAPARNVFLVKWAYWLNF